MSNSKNVSLYAKFRYARNLAIFTASGLYVYMLLAYFTKEKLLFVHNFIGDDELEWIIVSLTTLLIAIFFMLSLRINENISTVENKINENSVKINNVSKTIHREILSINQKNISYDSKIVKNLFKSHKNPVSYLVEKLEVGISSPIDGSDVSDAFELASKAEFAKACCLVSDKKYIENNTNVGNLLYYFYKQKKYTDGHLNINRIFSFPLKDEEKFVDFSSENDKYILLLYMIFNYTSNVNTYLHAFNKTSCGTGVEASFCTQIDYVSLMLYKKEDGFNYNAFITPQEDELNLVVVKDNDILLHKFLEEDYTVRAEAKSDIDENRDHYCVKFKPANYTKIFKLLGMNHVDVKSNLTAIIGDLPSEIFNNINDFKQQAALTRVNSYFEQIDLIKNANNI